jgi:peptidyl-prolyl cis-trans isomerase C
MLRSPLVHFLALGGALLALRMWWAPDEPRDARPQVVIAAGDVARLRAAWSEEHGTPPTAAAERRLVDAAIEEEVLYREALRRGFDRQDDAVRERLVRLGGFVGEEGSRDALEREARQLGLEGADLVIRRHLVEMMRLAAARLGPDEMPTEAELEAYLAEHAADFAEPARVRLTHVYVSEDAHGAAARAIAASLLDDLRGGGRGAAVGRGDAFIHGAEIDASPDEIARFFGPEFAAGLAGIASGRWEGPLRSTYGFHLVWVDARTPARTPDFVRVHGRVLHRWLSEKQDARARATIAALRARYAVVVEGG